MSLLILQKLYAKYHNLVHQVKFAGREARLYSFYNLNPKTRMMDKKNYASFIKLLVKFMKVESPYKHLHPVVYPKIINTQRKKR